MSRTTYGHCLLAIALFALTLTAAAADRQFLERGHTMHPEMLEAFVDGTVRHAMQTQHIAGVGVSVVQDGQTLLRKGYGYASFDPARAVDPHTTLFRIGSVSKTFTWILLMQEVERGRVALDEPVNNYLPAELRIPDQGFERPIRFRDLMAHAGGFDEREFGVSRVDTPSAFVPLRDYLRNNRPDRVREAGVLASYSNYGVALIGAALAHLHQEDFETLAEERVLRPLRLSATTFRQPYAAGPALPAPMSRALAERVSTGFTWNGNAFEPEAFEHLETVPAGAVSATAADMARYMLMLLNDGTLDGIAIYKPQTAQLFRSTLLDVPRGVNGWAHGFAVMPLPGGFTGYGHGGTTLLFYTNMVVVPELNLGIFVSINTNTGRALRDRLAADIIERFYVSGHGAPAAGEPALRQRAADYAGHYISTRRAYSGLQKFLGLKLQTAQVSVTPDGYLLTKMGGHAQRWVPTGGPNRFRAVAGPESFEFVVDANGRSISWIAPNGTSTFERSGVLHSPAVLAFLAKLVAAVAVGTLIAGLMRREEIRRAQRWPRVSSVLVMSVSALWLATLLGYRAVEGSMHDSQQFFYDWPNHAVLFTSSSALLASVLTLGLVASLLVTYVNRSNDTSWSLARYVRHAAIVAVYTSFVVVLAAWGALLPWSV